MKDIRLNTGFLDHPKTIKLLRRLGWEGVKSLLRLWFFAALNRCKGILSNMTPEDIAIAAGWQQDVQQFVDCMFELGWLDVSECGSIYSLHNWEMHQGFIFYSEERREIAIKAGKASARKRLIKGNPQQSVEQGVKQGVEQKTQKRSTPSPSPSPSPIPKDICVSDFWNLYPHRNGVKIGKAEAIEAIEKHIKPEEYPLLIQATKNFAVNPDAQRGIGVKDPQRFIIAGRGKNKIEPWREWINPEIQTSPDNGNGKNPSPSQSNLRDAAGRKLEYV